MKKLWVFLSLLTLFNLSAQQALFDKANAFYQEAQYEEAEALYDSIIASGQISADLYYNLGNAQYKNGKIAPCILSYERALQLKPNDADIQYNLELVQQHVVDELDEVDVFFLKKIMHKWRRAQSSDFWAKASLLTFAILIIAVILYILSQRSTLKKTSFYVGLIALVLCIGMWHFARQNKADITAHRSAIILAPTVTVNSSPNDSGTKIFVLHEGTKVDITDQLNGWVEIRLSDGHKGWVKANTIEAI